MSKKTFLRAVEMMAGSVWDLHERFGIPTIAGISEEGTLLYLRDRLSIQMEELGELSGAINKGRLEEIPKEAADVLYVALGTIAVLDDVGASGCLEVAKKNDRKTAELYKFHEQTGKILKT